LSFLFAIAWAMPANCLNPDQIGEMTLLEFKSEIFHFHTKSRDDFIV